MTDIIEISAICIFTILVLYTLFSIPAMLTLPPGIRPGLEELTIDEAVGSLKSMNLPNLELIQETRKLLVTRMQYCRRNSYDSYRTAFRRGYGYCVQQAFALNFLLTELGFESKVVQSHKNRFANGTTGGHAWVRIHYNNTTIEIDPSDKNWQNEKMTFVPLKKVTGFSFFFRILTIWGSAGVNAYKYYTKGKDE